jgi:hypothetical protein
MQLLCVEQIEHRLCDRVRRVIIYIVDACIFSLLPPRGMQ